MLDMYHRSISSCVFAMCNIFQSLGLVNHYGIEKVCSYHKHIHMPSLFLKVSEKGCVWKGFQPTLSQNASSMCTIFIGFHDKISVHLACFSFNMRTYEINELIWSHTTSKMKTKRHIIISLGTNYVNFQVKIVFHKYVNTNVGQFQVLGQVCEFWYKNQAQSRTSYEVQVIGLSRAKGPKLELGSNHFFQL